MAFTASESSAIPKQLRWSQLTWVYRFILFTVLEPTVSSASTFFSSLQYRHFTFYWNIGWLDLSFEFLSEASVCCCLWNSQIFCMGTFRIPVSLFSIPDLHLLTHASKMILNLCVWKMLSFFQVWGLHAFLNISAILVSLLLLVDSAGS